MNIRVIYYPELVKCLSYNLIKQIKFLYHNKRIINNLFNIINIDKHDSFFFPSKLYNLKYAGPVAYFMRKISKVASVYVSNVMYAHYQKVDSYVKSDNIFSKFKYLSVLYSLVFGVDLDIYEIKNVKYYMGIDEKYIENNKISKYNLGIDSKDLRDSVIQKQKKIFDEEYDNMILDDGFGLSEKCWDLGSIKLLYDKIFCETPKFAIKKHPGIINIGYSRPDIVQETLKNDYKYFPSYIPAEFLFKNVKKNIIGFISAVLVTAAKQNHLQSISLLELVHWKSEKVKKVYKDFLVNQEKRILFPKTIDEVVGLLNS